MASLKGSDIFDLVCGQDGLVQGFQISSVNFYRYLVIMQNIIEGMRDWMFLRATDSTLTSQKTDQFDTAYDISNLSKPFVRPLEEGALILVNPNNKQDWLEMSEVPYSDRYRYQTETDKFCIDYANNKLYILGIRDLTRTIQLNYIFQNTDITSTTTWPGVPTTYHGVLPFGMAAMWKAGSDFDSENAQSAIRNDEDSNRVLEMMINWDANLQLQSLKGRDRHGPGNRPQFYSGRINLG